MEAVDDINAIPIAAPAERVIRRVLISSIVGTAVEWYDFMIYATATGLVFNRLFFPSSNASLKHHRGLRYLCHRLPGTPDRRGDLRPLRRQARPQGDAVRHHRHHGLWHLRHRIAADLRPDRYRRALAAGVPAAVAGHWPGRPSGAVRC